jgi:hypothetical protein
MRAWKLFGPQSIERDHLHNHIQMQPVIHVAPDGQHARVRSRALSQLGTFGTIGIWGDGVYENELVKEGGVWKIKKDHVYTTFFAPYDTGWARGARPTPKVSDKIPPDKPPSETYESFPDIYIPPFHYRIGTGQKAAKSRKGTLDTGRSAGGVRSHPDRSTARRRERYREPAADLRILYRQATLERSSRSLR